MRLGAVLSAVPIAIVRLAPMPVAVRGRLRTLIKPYGTLLKL